MPWKKSKPKRKGLSPNHYFQGLAVGLSECNWKSHSLLCVSCGIFSWNKIHPLTRTGFSPSHHWNFDKCTNLIFNHFGSRWHHWAAEFGMHAVSQSFWSCAKLTTSLQKHPTAQWGDSVKHHALRPLKATCIRVMISGVCTEDPKCFQI